MCEEKNKTQSRAVKAYLKPKNHILFDGFVDATGVSESAAINMIVKDFFSRLPETQRSEYMVRMKSKNSY